MKIFYCAAKLDCAITCLAHQTRHTVQFMIFDKSYKQIVFCDFDGTITAEETFVGMLKQFATVPYSAVEAQLTAGKLTLKDAVRRLVESIPTQCHSQVLQYISDKRIRDGFTELLDFLHYHGVPFVVVSGGLVESVTAKLIPYRERIHAIYAAETSVAGDFLSVSSEFESPSELVAKTRVMDQYSCKQSIVIGDGITDLNIAMAADLVFARGHLAGYLKSRGKPHIIWKDFFDVCNHLAKRWLAS